MENAAKALLISAGVLIAILVMSLFSYIVTQMSEDTASIAEIAQKSKISKFNQQFLNFDDKHNLTIQDVATIVNLALDNNESKKRPIYITVKVNNETWTDTYKNKSDKILEENVQNIIDQVTYSCTVNIDTSTLYVKEVIITKN